MNQIRGAYRRNSAIAEALIHSKSPVVLPIGFRHVNDLKEQMINLCKTATANSGSIDAPSPALE